MTYNIMGSKQEHIYFVNSLKMSHWQHHVEHFIFYQKKIHASKFVAFTPFLHVQKLFLLHYLNDHWFLLEQKCIKCSCSNCSEWRVYSLCIDSRITLTVTVGLQFVPSLIIKFKTNVNLLQHECLHFVCILVSTSKHALHYNKLRRMFVKNYS